MPAESRERIEVSNIAVSRGDEEEELVRGLNLVKVLRYWVWRRSSRSPNERRMEWNWRSNRSRRRGGWSKIGCQGVGGDRGG